VGSLLPSPTSWDFPDPSVTRFFIEGRLEPTTCSGVFSKVAAIVPFLQGLRELDVNFLGSCPFPDAGLGVTSEPQAWGSLDGFIAPILLPSNLNGLDGVSEGVPEASGPLDLQGEATTPSGYKHPKRSKCIRISSDTSNLILGEDLSMFEVVKMANKYVVGKTIKVWAAFSSGSTHNPPPLHIRRLSHGWFLIIFAEAKQSSQALTGSWTIDSSLVLLKLWDPTFNASCKIMDSFPILVRLPRLPPHLWSVKVFQSIGNLMGTYLDFYFSFRETGDMALACILVSLNIRGGLRKEHNITDMGRSRTQILDYEDIPF